MKNIFETKESYLKFKKNWKNFHKEEKHKKYKVSYDWCTYVRTGEFSTPGKGWELKKGSAYYWKSDLTATHQLIYGIVTGVKINKMFKQLSSNPYDYEHRYGSLIHAMNSITRIDPITDKVFGGTITKEQLEKIYQCVKFVYERTSKFTDMLLE